MPVIVMTGHGTMQTAVEATKLGAFDYYLKPFDPAETLTSIRIILPTPTKSPAPSLPTRP